MKKFYSFFEEKVGPVVEKLARNHYLIGIRDGMIATVPFTIIGSVFIIIQQFPVQAWLDFIAPISDMLSIPNSMTMGKIAIIVAFSVGYCLAREFDVDTLTGGLLSTIAFFTLQVTEEYELETAYFGSKGIFTAIVVALLSVKTVELFTKKNWTIHFPEGVPPAVSQAFASLIPGAVVLTICWLFSTVLGLNIPAIITVIFSPLVFALNTYPGILVYMVVSQLLWCVGIHGQSVLNAVGTPVFLTYIAANQEAFLAGQQPPYITASGFIPNFISLGGAGATLGLAILMCFSREKGYRVLGRLSVAPGIFNINEPIIFGFPIVMNPIMMIPFILTDVVLLSGTYLLMWLNIIGRPVMTVPWIMPPIIGAFLVTGNNVPAMIWSIIELGLSMLIYLPFLRIAEKQRLEEETQQNSQA